LNALRKPCFFWLAVILCVMASCTNDSDLRRLPEDIRADLLKEYPLGSTISDVEAKLRAKNLEPKVYRNVGFLKQENATSEEVGDQSIRVELGGYRSSFLLYTSVTVFWGFNARSELIDIWVWKTTDGP
jgi:hypothetical protein